MGILEIRPAKKRNGVILWTPETDARLTPKEAAELLKMVSGKEERIERFRSTELEVTEFKSYVEFSFFEHTGSEVINRQMMMDKSQLEGLISGLAKAVEDCAPA